MSACLDVLCPHSCLSPMVVHHKTYILMSFVIVMHSIHPSPVHGPRTPWWASTKLIKDVKQILAVCDAFYRAKIAKKPGYPCWISNESTWFKGKCTLFLLMFGNCRRLSYKISAYEVCIICPKRIAACKIHRKSTARWSHYAMVHSPWSNPFGLRKGIDICAEPCGVWKSASYSAFACPTNISKTQKRCKQTGYLNEIK